VLERARHPRYKTCGGGLVGASLAALDTIGLAPPARDHIDTVRFTLRGRRGFQRRRAAPPLLAMVRRDELDDALREAAEKAGAVVRQRCAVRGVEQDGEYAYARLADGTRIAGRYLVGADGSAGVTARHVGVHCGQTDLGLELELPVPPPIRQEWRGVVLIDWGPLPGSYGWVFPKDDRLTVGVIASKGYGEQTRAYLRDFVSRLGLDGIEPAEDSGHLTRCRTWDSPLSQGRVLVAGDAAGLLEPWTREGISYALRSGLLAGRAAAAGQPARYVADVEATLVPEMLAGQRLLAAFARHPGTFHTALATPPGWRTFTRFCASDVAFARTLQRPAARLAISVLAR
jgi:geranylgeranyl reductase family protein